MYDLTVPLGFIGAIVGTIAYGPQIVHIVKERCSHGLSLSAWTGWFISSALLMPHALVLGDPVFLALQVLGLLATGGVLALAKVYEGRRCSSCSPKDGSGRE